jgi:hypothetical protein
MSIGSLFSGLVSGAVTGLETGGPIGAIAGGIGGAAVGATSPGGLTNISSSTDPTLATQQQQDLSYEQFNTAMQGEELRHQENMQTQSQQFDDVQDERSEQMREMNTLRSVAMKQREADDKIVKEFIKTAGGE